MVPPESTAELRLAARGLEAVLPECGSRSSLGSRCLRAGALTCSAVAAPPVAVAAAMFLAASVSARSGAWMASVLYVLVGVVTPVLVVAMRIRRRQVRDVELTRREERLVPQAAAAASLLVAWLVLLALAAPRPMTLLAAGLALQSFIVLLVTLRWKISVHSAAAAVAGTLIALALHWFVPATLVVAAVAWSRWHLDRHTLAQIVAGAALGAVVSTGVWVLLGSS